MTFYHSKIQHFSQNFHFCVKNERFYMCFIGSFKYTKKGYGTWSEEEDNDPWSRENYTIEDSLYDALGGEMDAIWNID